MQAQPSTGDDTRWNLDYYTWGGNANSGSNIFSMGIGGYWSPDGTKYYTGNLSGSVGSVNQHVVSTPYDISSLDTTDVYVLQIDANNWPRDVHFKPDGTSMFLCMGRNSTYPEIKEYSMTTPWDISTATATGKTFDPSGFYDAERGIFTSHGYCISMSDDGEVLLWDAVGTDTIYEIKMTTPWDLATANHTSQSFYAGNIGGGQPFGLHVIPDGTKWFFGDQSSVSFYELSMTTAWDITSSVYQSRSIDYNADTGNGIAYEPNFSPDGMYFVAHDFGASPNDIGYGWHRYDYTGTYTKPRTTYDIEYAVQSSNSHSFGFSPGGVRFKDDGTKAYVINRTSDVITQYSVSPAWDSSGMTQDKTFSIVSQDSLANGLFFKSDGTEMYLAGGNTDTIYQYSLSSSWDIGSAALSGSLSVTTQQALPTDVWFTSDGTTMMVVGTAGEPIDKYTLSQAWTVTSATHDSNTTLTHLANAPGANYGAWSIDFNPTGDEFIISAVTPYDNVQQYALGTALDLASSASFQYSKILPIYQGGAGYPSGISFGNSGTKLYVCSVDDNMLYEYDLT